MSFLLISAIRSLIILQGVPQTLSSYSFTKGSCHARHLLSTNLYPKASLKNPRLSLLPTLFWVTLLMITGSVLIFYADRSQLSMSSHVRITYLTAFFWHHLSRYLKDMPSWTWLNWWSFLAKLEHFSQGWHCHSFILIASQTHGGNMDVLPSLIFPTELHKWGFYKRNGPSKSSQEYCSLDFWASVSCGILVSFTVYYYYFCCCCFVFCSLRQSLR